MAYFAIALDTNTSTDTPIAVSKAYRTADQAHTHKAWMKIRTTDKGRYQFKRVAICRATSFDAAGRKAERAWDRFLPMVYRPAVPKPRDSRWAMH